MKHDYTSTRHVQNGGYFDTMLPFFIVVGVWLLLVVFKAIEIFIKRTLPNILNRINELIIPSIGTLPFIIILQSLITVFRCERGTG